MRDAPTRALPRMDLPPTPVGRWQVGPNGPTNGSPYPQSPNPTYRDTSRTTRGPSEFQYPLMKRFGMKLAAAAMMATSFGLVGGGAIAVADSFHDVRNDTVSAASLQKGAENSGLGFSQLERSRTLGWATAAVEERGDDAAARKLEVLRPVTQKEVSDESAEAFYSQVAKVVNESVQDSEDSQRTGGGVAASAGGVLSLAALRKVLKANRRNKT